MVRSGETSRGREQEQEQGKRVGEVIRGGGEMVRNGGGIGKGWD